MIAGTRQIVAPPLFQQDETIDMATAPTPKRPTARRATPARKPRKPGPPRKNLPALSATAAFSIGAIVVAAGAALTGYLARRQIAAWAELPEGHAAEDLLGDARPAPGDRAPVDFRPDPTAPLSAAERAALRPA